MANRSGEYLHTLAKKIGASGAVVASSDGLLVAGSGGEREALEEIAAYAPSGLPKSVVKPTGLSTKRIEIEGEKFYLAALGGETTKEAALEVAQLITQDFSTSSSSA
jgi:predicted regulator of Ras-like GTPase activity (Roadblock/LC7/MglB family)